MNFLSHYYFDNKPNNPYFNLGLIFPDLVRNFVKGSKLNLNIDPPVNDLELSLLKGCIQHVQSDKTFHAWDGFHEAMNFVTQSIRTSSTEIPKDWFVSHILVELAIDRFLLIQNPNLAKKLYTEYNLVDSKVLQSFLSKNEFDNFELFEEGFTRFKEIQYLNSYTEIDNIVYALGKICTKMRLQPFSEEQKMLLSSIITNLDKQLPSLIEELEVELK